jgi:hypothetical protein
LSLETGKFGGRVRKAVCYLANDNLKISGALSFTNSLDKAKLCIPFSSLLYVLGFSFCFLSQQMPTILEIL